MAQYPDEDLRLNKEMYALLHAGDYEVILHKLKEGLDIQWGAGSILSSCCRNGHLDMVKYLLTSPELSVHADIHANFDDAISSAALWGHLHIVEYLLTSPELKTNATVQKETLVNAARAGHSDMLEYLLQYHPMTDEAYFKACENGRAEVVDFILREQLIDAHEGGGLGFIMASHYNQLAVIECIARYTSLDTPEIREFLTEDFHHKSSVMSLVKSYWEKELLATEVNSTKPSIKRKL